MALDYVDGMCMGSCLHSLCTNSECLQAQLKASSAQNGCFSSVCKLPIKFIILHHADWYCFKTFLTWRTVLG